MEGASGAVAMGAGFYHGCVLRTDGKLFCWGLNNQGQLGIGTTADQHNLAAATAVTFPSTDATIQPVELAVGGYHACARLSNGKVFCWGSNVYGQLGDGTSNNNRLSPVQVNFGTGVLARSIAAGSNHTCAVLSNGTARCWGWNTNGQIGDNSLNPSSTPREVKIAGSTTALDELVSITAGGYHTCALTVRGAVHCWGIHFTVT